MFLGAWGCPYIPDRTVERKIRKKVSQRQLRHGGKGGHCRDDKDDNLSWRKLRKTTTRRKGCRNDKDDNWSRRQLRQLRKRRKAITEWGRCARLREVWKDAVLTSALLQPIQVGPYRRTQLSTRSTTTDGQGDPTLPRYVRLLPTLHSRLCNDCKTSTQVDPQGCTLHLG